MTNERTGNLIFANAFVSELWERVVLALVAHGVQGETNEAVARCAALIADAVVKEWELRAPQPRPVNVPIVGPEAPGPWNPPGRSQTVCCQCGQDITGTDHRGKCPGEPVPRVPDFSGLADPEPGKRDAIRQRGGCLVGVDHAFEYGNEDCIFCGATCPPKNEICVARKLKGEMAGSDPYGVDGLAIKGYRELVDAARIVLRFPHDVWPRQRLEAAVRACELG
jgi:hypothetical protein